MSRDPGKLKVFAMADELVTALYRATAGLPVEKLIAALARAACSLQPEA
jgi:hypothetical protein